MAAPVLSRTVPTRRAVVCAKQEKANSEKAAVTIGTRIMVTSFGARGGLSKPDLQSELEDARVRHAADLAKCRRIEISIHRGEIGVIQSIKRFRAEPDHERLPDSEVTHEAQIELPEAGRPQTRVACRRAAITAVHDGIGGAVDPIHVPIRRDGALDGPAQRERVTHNIGPRRADSQTVAAALRDGQRSARVSLQ